MFSKKVVATGSVLAKKSVEPRTDELHLTEYHGLIDQQCGPWGQFGLAETDISAHLSVFEKKVVDFMYKLFFSDTRAIAKDDRITEADIATYYRKLSSTKKKPTVKIKVMHLCNKILSDFYDQINKSTSSNSQNQKQQNQKQQIVELSQSLSNELSVLIDPLKSELEKIRNQVSNLRKEDSSLLSKSEVEQIQTALGLDRYSKRFPNLDFGKHMTALKTGIFNEKKLNNETFIELIQDMLKYVRFQSVKYVLGYVAKIISNYMEPNDRVEGDKFENTVPSKIIPFNVLQNTPPWLGSRALLDFVLALQGELFGVRASEMQDLITGFKTTSNTQVLCVFYEIILRNRVDLVEEVIDRFEEPVEFIIYYADLITKEQHERRKEGTLDGPSEDDDPSTYLVKSLIGNRLVECYEEVIKIAEDELGVDVSVLVSRLEKRNMKLSGDETKLNAKLNALKRMAHSQMILEAIQTITDELQLIQRQKVFYENMIQERKDPLDASNRSAAAAVSDPVVTGAELIEEQIRSMKEQVLLILRQDTKYAKLHSLASLKLPENMLVTRLSQLDLGVSIEAVTTLLFLNETATLQQVKNKAGIFYRMATIIRTSFLHEKGCRTNYAEIERGVTFIEVFQYVLMEKAPKAIFKIFQMMASKFLPEVTEVAFLLKNNKGVLRFFNFSKEVLDTFDASVAVRKEKNAEALQHMTLATPTKDITKCLAGDAQDISRLGISDVFIKTLMGRPDDVSKMGYFHNLSYKHTDLFLELLFKYMVCSKDRFIFVVDQSKVPIVDFAELLIIYLLKNSEDPHITERLFDLVEFKAATKKKNKKKLQKGCHFEAFLKLQLKPDSPFFSCVWSIRGELTSLNDLFNQFSEDLQASIKAKFLQYSSLSSSAASSSSTTSQLPSI